MSQTFVDSCLKKRGCYLNYTDLNQSLNLLIFIYLQPNHLFYTFNPYTHQRPYSCLFLAVSNIKSINRSTPQKLLHTHLARFDSPLLERRERVCWSECTFIKVHLSAAVGSTVIWYVRVREFAELKRATCPLRLEVLNAILSKKQNVCVCVCVDTRQL